jgi:hypothetical protein
MNRLQRLQTWLAQAHTRTIQGAPLRRRTTALLVLCVSVVAMSVGLFSNLSAQTTLFERDLFDARADLQVLAFEALGDGNLPASWTGNEDLASPTFLPDLWFDNEQLADQVFGVGTRPPNWIGATTRIPTLLLRNVRHDLELTADNVFGNADTRPDTWRGAAKIVRCDRTLQNMIYLLEQFYEIRNDVSEGVLNYCAALAISVEDELVARTLGIPGEGEAPELILAVRGDLERLADEKLGLNNRPQGWLGNKEIDSPTLISDNFLDLESLANSLLGANQRPEDWIGAVTGSPSISYRNLRHDLEILADLSLGVGVRPRGWQGLDPLNQCAPLTQSFVLIVQQNYVQFAVPTQSEGQSGEAYCASVEAAANTIAENPPPSLSTPVPDEDTRFLAESRIAFAYLDVTALQYMGQMPFGTQFRAWYRNFNTSSMMFVTGEGFALFIDHRWTTLDPELFGRLPTLEGRKPLTFCDASWCNGPGPTPTPTGSGPLEQILFQNTPAATAPSADELRVQLQQVSWNNIRVTYVLDNPTTRTAQVALEICAEAAQIACEPVSRVFDRDNNIEKGVLTQFNGLNVYELGYGYNANVLVEGPTRFSIGIWVSDPALR